jgi:hypothetical protein
VHACFAGTNGNAVYVYDIESKRCLTRLSNHQDDVNAVVGACLCGVSAEGVHLLMHAHTLTLTVIEV